MAAQTSSPVIAGASVKFAVGRSSDSAWTSSLAPKVRASWLIAAPPARKFATICAVTSAGKAETPRAATPWLPAKTRAWGFLTSGRSVPRQPAYQIARLELPERCGRLGQLRVPRCRGFAARGIGLGQVAQAGAHGCRGREKDGWS